MKKINTFLKLIIVFFILSGSLFAQVTQEWVQIYNGPGNGSDVANSIAVDGYGNVYVTGESYGSDPCNYITTIKYNSNGIQQWVTRYYRPGSLIFDNAKLIVVDGSGNVYITGSTTTGYGHQTTDYLTIKYNSAGVQQWVATYNGPGNDEDQANSIAVDPSGNVYVTGFSYLDSVTCEFATIKYNSAGVQQWVQRNYGTATSLALDGSGNVFVTGYSIRILVYITYDYTTIKYNSSGVRQWIAYYDGVYGYGYWHDYARHLALDGSGNVYVTGESYYSLTGYDYATIKYNSSGVQQWVTKFNNVGPGIWDNCKNYLAVDGSGNVYVAGTGLGTGTDWDYATIKYNSSGVQQWVATYNGLGNDTDIVRSLALDGSGNVYVTGCSTNGSTYGTGDYATIRYNSAGVQQWVARYSGPGNNTDEVRSLALNGSGNVYVTGYSWVGQYYNGNADYATIKYSQQIGVQNISSEIPSSFSLSQNFPNPFNPSTKIKIDIPKSDFVSLKIFDALGREVAILVNEQLNPGTYEADWNALNYPSGVYFYRLTTESFSDSKKMLLIK